MRIKKIRALRHFAGAVALGALLSSCAVEPPGMPANQVPSEASRQDSRALAADVFTYGYPLVLMDVTRQVMTAKVPLNAFSHRRAFPDAGFTDVVSPNADTLYSSAWLDLAGGPVVMTVPDTRGRYYVMPMMDAWTNVFASVGKRSTGTGRGVYAITGPGWHGTLPNGMKEIRSPTSMVWLIGRTQTNGKADYTAVHQLQNQFRLAPLHAPPQPGTAEPQEALADMALDMPVDTETPPVEQVAAMDAQSFFTRLALLLPANPPARGDAAMVEKMNALGIVPGEPFLTTVLEPETARAIQEGATRALARITAAAQQPDSPQGRGWQIRRNLGSYGKQYGERAVVAMVGLGANLAQDAIYPTTRTDADGHPLVGTRRYILHFDKDKLPPARAFWSLSMYNERQSFVTNAIDRYTIGSRDRLRFNRDGSLDIYVQYEHPPAAKLVNWLPAPAGPFNLILRLYWPEQAALDGTWAPPPVRRLD